MFRFSISLVVITDEMEEIAGASERERERREKEEKTRAVNARRVRGS